MNAWCLPVNAVGGELIYIPLSGAAKRGGSLLFGASWSIDAGDGIDDKCIFRHRPGRGRWCSPAPTRPAHTNWRQEGRYDISKPLGKNGHQQLGGDILIATVDGIVPLSVHDAKRRFGFVAVGDHLQHRADVDAGVHDQGRVSVDARQVGRGRRAVRQFPRRQDPRHPRQSASAICTPAAWCALHRLGRACASCDCAAACSSARRTARSMQVDSSGLDDTHWDESTRLSRQHLRLHDGRRLGDVPGAAQPSDVDAGARDVLQLGRASRSSRSCRATTDYEFRIPPPPNAGPDPGVLDVWDQGLWGQRQRRIRRHRRQRGLRAWDQPGAGVAVNTMWVSIGETGFQPCADLQVTVGQQVKPDVELISISATFLRMAANV